ncbi:MAG: hypothetical protein NC914_03515, partial [Candidatus Omnitrophica bacterium]|nr:hypothetical protein [Candidatus Omnitrophota bacterium]
YIIKRFIKTKRIQVKKIALKIGKFIFKLFKKLRAHIEKIIEKNTIFIKTPICQRNLNLKQRQPYRISM